MQLTVLGCWAPYPRPEEACSGYLLQAGSVALMLDSGHGSFARLAKHIDYRQLTGLVVTHYHPDHYADIHCLRHAISGARRDGRMNSSIKLFVPPEPVEIYRQLAGYTDAFSVVNIAELPSVELPGAKIDNIPGPPPSTCDLFSISARVARLNKITLHFVSTMHGMPGYAVLIRHGEKSVFYSGDTAPTSSIINAARNAGLLLCEASGMDKDSEFLAGEHMTARQAGELARQTGVKKLVLTHFWPEYDIDELLTEARESFDGPVLAAKQDAVFKCY
ncbi:MBL fold metallo-hydrolase [Desulfallas thermosapovorans]|uniref:Ribonuclease BN (tRNA processing enzyme) n=1 Tax=Desulfallas thermosapovorans DSM 6562 TaxID=1121431 RepID=A0A5S4ZTP3_9FIRM|nr:MBL fold metallo-hydrolase [Desulfallas thermosapovorans]TYO96139.1 ribonuclease BN (tRNA processing enzyme) [Desulfallas thermosapovorans DSM 6562]